MALVKDYSREPVDLKAVFKNPKFRLADFHAKLYDLGTGATLTTTERGCISITVFCKPKNVKAYIETEAEAVEVLDAVIDEVLKRH